MRGHLLTLLLFAAPLAAQDEVAIRTAGCNAGVGADCARLAELVMSGVGVPADRSRAEQLSLRACDLGTPAGCTQVGRWLLGGLYLNSDPPRAVALFRRAC